jgi:eukaryotic translation initiation factor 2C
MSPTKIKPKSESSVPILKRDGFGTKGRVVTVKANSFEVTKISKYDEFLKYTLEIKPIDADKNIKADIKRERSDYGKSIRRRVLKELGLKKEDWFQNVVIAYDGGTTLFTTGRLGFDKETETKSVVENIILKDLHNLNGDSTQYNVQISRTDTVIKLTQLEKYISGEEFEWDFFSDDALDVLNALIHQRAAEKFIKSGKSSIYNRGNKAKITGGIELWSGWFSTVRPGQESLFVNVNPTFTTFYQPLRLDEFLLQYLYPKYQYLPDEFNEYQLKDINEILKGLLVHPRHLESVQTERRIKKLLPATKVAHFEYKPEADSDETFPLEQYFKDKYQRRETTQLFVEIMSEEGTHIAWPIEFCQITEGQRYRNKQLTGKQRAEIISAAKMKPYVHEKETIKGAHEILQLQKNPTGVGMEVAFNLAEVDAHVLESTTVEYAENVTIPANNGKWNLKNVKFVKSGEMLAFWQVVVFEQEKRISAKDVYSFIEKLITQCKIQGMNIAKNIPHIKYVQYRKDDLDKVIKSAYEDAKKTLNRPPQMLLFIIPGDKTLNTNTKLYETIKRVMDTEIGCLSQCVSVNSNYKKHFNNLQYCANLSMKINLKLGGINSILPEKKLSLPSGEDVLLLGADVTHPKDKNGRSICSVVGSLDDRATHFVTNYQAQERSGKEEIINIDKMIKEVLEDYCNYKKNKTGNDKKTVASLLPPCIIMYRDGVSESQFERVLKWELPKIKEACAEFQAGYQPKITFAVIGKRHHTRLFPGNPKEADKNGNCLVGTVVDKKITHPTLNDFYLQSHYANQGMARPSHYTILHNEIKLTTDEFQGLSNALCYNFQRTTSSVSIPSPTYYAHLTCARAKMYLSDDMKLPKVHPNLKKYPMYFM